MAGAVGMNEESLWNTSPRVLVWMYAGHVEAQEAQIQSIWEAARLMSVSVVNANGGKIRRPQALISFPWEVQETKLTKEDIKRLKSKFQHGIKRS